MSCGFVRCSNDTDRIFAVQLGIPTEINIPTEMRRPLISSHLQFIQFSSYSPCLILWYSSRLSLCSVLTCLSDGLSSGCSQQAGWD